MTLDEMIAQNSGVRPDRHWECIGCGECWSKPPYITAHPNCGPVMLVQLYDSAPIKLNL